MPVFHFKAVSASGEIQEGERSGTSEQAVVAELQLAGYIPIEVSAEPRRKTFSFSLGAKKQELNTNAVSTFTDELSVLLGAGLTLDKSLSIVHNLASDDATKTILAEIHEQVRSGEPLSIALSGQGNTFSGFYISMVQAGELGGTLDVALTRLAEHMKRARELHEQIVSATIYPALLFFVSILSVIILLAFVVPRFAELFSDMGEALPVSTQIVLACGEFMQHYWWLVILVIASMIVITRHIYRLPAYRKTMDKLLIRTPLAGDVIVKMEIARIARTLGTLLGNGVSILASFGIAKNTVSNSAVAEDISLVEQRIREGGNVAESMVETQTFPPFAVQMISVGEETGNLEKMLLRVADHFDNETSHAIQRMLAMLEPALIVTLGLLIGGIVMSILSAILSVNSLAF